MKVLVTIKWKAVRAVIEIPDGLKPESLEEATAIAKAINKHEVDLLIQCSEVAWDIEERDV